MPPLAACDSRAAPALLPRARCDQVATLYSDGHLTVSMCLGAAIFCGVMWEFAPHAPHALLAGWPALVVLNQSWRTALLCAWQRVRPGAAAAPALGPLLGGAARRSPARCGARRPCCSFPTRWRTRRF